MTHDLVYKADDVDWRKERLAAQLKAAVEQIEMIIGAFESASLAVLESPWPESDMRSTIVDKFRTLLDEGVIPETLRPQSWSRFADNVVTLIKTFRGDPSRREEWLSRILNSVEADLRVPERPPLPVSGTLFQYVLAIISRDDTPGDISRFTVVPSRELSEFYNVRNVPRPFVFDGVAAITPSSEEVHEDEIRGNEAEAVEDQPGPLPDPPSETMESPQDETTGPDVAAQADS